MAKFNKGDRVRVLNHRPCSAELHVGDETTVTKDVTSGSLSASVWVEKLSHRPRWYEGGDSNEWVVSADDLELVTDEKFTPDSEWVATYGEKRTIVTAHTGFTGGAQEDLVVYRDNAGYSRATRRFSTEDWTPAPVVAPTFEKGKSYTASQYNSSFYYTVVSVKDGTALVWSYRTVDDTLVGGDGLSLDQRDQYKEYTP